MYRKMDEDGVLPEYSLKYGNMDISICDTKERGERMTKILPGYNLRY
jgi:hypothetical protein